MALWISLVLDRFSRDCRVSVRDEVEIQKLVTVIIISCNDDLDGRPLCFACGTCFEALTSLALDQMGRAPTVWMECSACSAGIDNITTFLDTNYMLSMPTTHMRISPVPACPSKLNDRRHETRNGA